MIDFPNSPTLNQTFTAAGVTWTWDGVKWEAAGVGGGTIGGIGDNRIINGDMRIDQRNNGASGSATNVYTVDRWNFGASLAGKGTWGRNFGAINTPAEFPYYLGFVSGTSYTSLAGDFFNFVQIIEADMVADFAWGTASAKPVTLSFWASSNMSGTFSGAIHNAADTRSYPFSFSIVSNVWSKVVVTIPGDTTGTWIMIGNAGSVKLVFDLGSGSTFRGSANAWASANYVGVIGAASVVATNGIAFVLTGVKLEVGSVATPYNRQSLAKSMADCQRYYQQYANFTVGGYSTAGQAVYPGATPYPVTMRATPTINLGIVSYGNASALTVAAYTDQTSMRFQFTAVAAAPAYAVATPLTLSAEL